MQLKKMKDIQNLDQNQDLTMLSELLEEPYENYEEYRGFTDHFEHYVSVGNTPSVRYVMVYEEPLGLHYFPPGVWAWTRLNDRFVRRPDLYEKALKVMLHEKTHNIFKYNEALRGNERYVQSHAEYLKETGDRSSSYIV